MRVHPEVFRFEGEPAVRVLSPWMASIVMKHARHKHRSRRSCESALCSPKTRTVTASNAHRSTPFRTNAWLSMNAAHMTLGDLSRLPEQNEMTPSRGSVACAPASSSSSSTSPCVRKTFRWLAVFVSMFATTAHGFLLAPAAGGVGDMRRGERGQGRSSCPTSGRIASSVSPAIGCVPFEKG